MTGFVYFCITSVRFELENGTDVNCQLISVELFRTELQGFYYMLQLCVCLRDREATDTRIDWARCSALRKDLTPMKCPIHRNSWWAQLLSILQILQWYCMMSRWTVVLLINFGIAYHIMSVTVLGWRNGHGPMIWYIPWSSMIIMIISHPFPPHHPIPRQVINLGELDSQRVVDGLQKISQFLDSYEKERSAELLEGVLDLLSPWLLIFPEILYLGNLYESIGDTYGICFTFLGVP